MDYWRSGQIRLRGIEPTDAEVFYRWNLDSERARQLEFVWPPRSLSETTDWVERQARREFDGEGYLWVIENAAGEPVGSISTHTCNRRVGTFSYALDIASEHRRQGFARSAILLVLQYYFAELRYQKATVSIHADNLPSIQLHERLGFRREGQLRRMVFTAGRHVDEIWYGMTFEEFLGRAGE
jgi:RimJ/RimL family protein N-acetyltransferase